MARAVRLELRARAWPARRREGRADRVGRAVRPVGQGQLPERRLPARRPGRSSPACPDRRSSSRRSRAATAPSTRPCSSCAASSASTDVFRVNGPAGLAALGVRHRVDPQGAQDRRPRLARRDVRPGRAAAPRRGDDDGARTDREPRHRRRLGRPGAPRRRPADRGRARHRLVGRARHARRPSSPPRPTPSCARQLADLPAARADAAPGVARHERRLRARRRPRRGGRRRQPLRPRAPPGRRRRRRRRRCRRRRWSTPARSSSASTPRSAPPTSSSAARHRCRRQASPRSRRASPSRRSSSARRSPVPTPARSPACRRRSSPSPTTRASRPTPRRSAAAPAILAADRRRRQDVGWLPAGQRAGWRSGRVTPNQNGAPNVTANAGEQPAGEGDEPLGDVLRPVPPYQPDRNCNPFSSSGPRSPMPPGPGSRPERPRVTHAVIAPQLVGDRQPLA